MHCTPIAAKQASTGDTEGIIPAHAESTLTGVSSWFAPCYKREGLPNLATCSTILQGDVHMGMHVSAPDADSQGVGLLVQAPMVELHAAVVHIHAVDQLTVTASCLLLPAQDVSWSS